MADDGRAAFFYGTLMAPQVLHRVCHGSTSPDNPIYAAHNLKTYPAVLHGHQRHRVKHADYPAIIPKDNAIVRGTYVIGLTEGDIWRLDIFEGSEYRREKVKARVLTQTGDNTGAGNVEGDEVDAETYIWIAGKDRLESSEWDFDEFQREKMRFWVGAEGEGEYAEVDEAVAARHDGTGGRGANGHITTQLEAQRDQDVMKNAV
ncbi:hypothetical protein AMS68_007299 [Peltaster fructicola]|uniref:Putative gamma-glutamylcyclotransferase n=1 Tax=Peltaster fructicola TaxID=286661 RepID=A0A6H0Y430_9PEZI|nr:hypothetical protein AMS68_007299 [Peltaster fructicola]